MHQPRWYLYKRHFTQTKENHNSFSVANKDEEKKADGMNGIMLHAGQTRPFSGVGDENEETGRGPGVREVNRGGRFGGWKGDKRNGDRVRGGVWCARRSARTTRSICMLGDVDHVGRGWPATPGSWLASGHPNATPTPTHAVLNPPHATQPPCTSTEASPQPAKLGE